MEKRRLTDVRIYDRWLQFSDAGQNKRKIRLPFGHGVRVGDYSFFSAKYRNIERIVAAPRGSRVTPTQLSPSFERTSVIAHPVTGSKVQLKFRVAVADLERFRARQVIEREHYLVATGRGMLLVCSFVDEEDHKSIRRWGIENLRKAHISVDPAVAHSQLRGIVGVAVLDALYHGNPKDGRAEFANAALGTSRWRDTWTRAEIVQKLRLAWASRFAVEAPYQGLGLGTLLARYLKIVARHYRAPAANFIEVITTEEKDAAFGSNNFLISAGYQQAPEPLKSGPLRVLNFESGDYENVRAVKKYYFADLRDD